MSGYSSPPISLESYSLLRYLKTNTKRRNMRAYKFRLYPTKTQEKTMRAHLEISKDLWNEMLAFTKEMYKNYRKFPTKKTLRETVKRGGPYSQVGQELVNRLYNPVWRKVKKQQNGFPRFKSIERMKSLVYPQFGFALDKKLSVTPFGQIAIKNHRKIEGEIRTLTLKREASGKWFAIFCVEQDNKQPRENKGAKVGVDLGLFNFATLSNGGVIKNPRYFKKHENNLAFLQRRLSRKKKRSKNRYKARINVARMHEKIANARADFLHKLSANMVATYSLIGLEKLASKEMAEHRFGKSINDASWRMFTNMLAYKAEEAGCRILFVNPENTSKMCSCCGAVIDKVLQERMHNCRFCGLSIDRDLNAAINILKKATIGTMGSNASGDEAVASSRKEDATRFIGW